MDADKAVSPVEAELNNLRVSLNTLGEMVNLLEKRLDPVLADKPPLAPESPSISTGIQTRIGVGSKIRTERSKVESISNQLSSITERLEI